MEGILDKRCGVGSDHAQNVSRQRAESPIFARRAVTRTLGDRPFCRQVLLVPWGSVDEQALHV